SRKAEAGMRYVTLLSTGIDAEHAQATIHAPTAGTMMNLYLLLSVPHALWPSKREKLLLKQYNDLNSIHNQLKATHIQLEAAHNQKSVEYRDQIGRLKKAVLNNLGKGHPTANTSLPLPQTRTQTQPQVAANTSVQVATETRIPTSPVASTSRQTIQWTSDQGKSIASYIAKQKDLLNASQRECTTLKNRIAELTTQLEAKSKLDVNTVTAIEKAELMEAELEGLHERLDKCEEDLNAAQSELAAAQSRNTELANEVEGYQAKADSDHTMMADAHSQIASLHEEYTKAQNELLRVKKVLKEKDARLSSYTDTSQTSVDVSISDKALGKRPEVYVPTATEWEKSATLLASLQKEVARLKQERIILDKELLGLRQKLKTKEDENKTLGDKLHTSADLAAELGKLHVAANARSAETHGKLLAANKELQRAKELIALREKEKEDTQIAMRVAESARQAEFLSRISELEKEITELTKARDSALAEIDDWEQNRGMWKRWGEAMALRARQWEAEAQKARKPRSDQASLHNKALLEVPPPLTPLSTAVMPLSPVSAGEPGHARKRPHDMPDTDVDGHCDVARSSGEETAQGRSALIESTESGGRKKARFEEGLGRRA
ncbi:hypothetical protein FRC09_010908, partial [Ceratobasidium sp. 395]